MKKITIATRESALALWQANFIREQLIKAHPDLEVVLLGMTTQGDQWLNAPLKEIGGKGLFIKELEMAMLEGRADLAVHSVKDLPAYLPDGFSLPLIGFRDDVRDALIGADGDVMHCPRAPRWVLPVRGGKRNYWPDARTCRSRVFAVMCKLD